MSKFIFEIHSRVNQAIKKGLTGYIPPDKVDREVNAESLNLWKKYSPMYEKDADIAAIMDAFRRQETVNLTIGAGTIIDAYQRPLAVSDGDTGLNIEIVDISEWSDRIVHPIKVPTATYPVCTFENKQITVRPVSIAKAKIYYLKYPKSAVYAYTTVGGRYIYDDTNSIDFEWPTIMHDDITNRVLANLGINFRELQLMQYSQLEKTQEGK